MKTHKEPKLIVVGAGPGDPEHISLKGVKALNNADVVLYDALVDKQLLAYATQAEKLFVGKRKGNHSYSQEQINSLIVDFAFNYGTVVRLKGGDSFIFGRGTEEIEHANTFGIQTEVIPGITSATAVPAGQGIALTKRHVSESFWVITGTTTKRQLSKDVELAAQSNATIVILMGMSRLKEITKIFQQYDKGDTAVAIIQNGSTRSEKIGLGSMDNIIDVAKEKKLSSPAIIVIGDVVKHSTKWAGFYKEVININA